LRAATLFLAGTCLVFFTGVFFFIFNRTMPDMLMTIETEYLQEQTNFLVNRFDDVQLGINVNALAIGAWNESVLYVQGNNSEYIEKNWTGTTPNRVFKYNFMIIKDAAGNNLFTDFHDYVSDREMPPPPGLVGRLSAFSLDVVTKNHSAQPQN
jgi:sensor domain CHASE-containing protein